VLRSGLRYLCVLLCMSVALLAKTPRPLAKVPILLPDRKTIDLAKFRGHTLVVLIFSTECENCIKTLDIMNKIQKDYGQQGLKVVGAAGDDRARFLLGPFIARYRPLFPIGYLDKAAIIKLADVPKDVRPVAPIVLFIDRWGMVREQYYGDHSIFKDPEKSLRALTMGMLKVTPVQASKPPVAAGQP
jgi:thiol-disulfide isomerase/thioredoxin